MNEFGTEGDAERKYQKIFLLYRRFLPLLSVPLLVVVVVLEWAVHTRQTFESQSDAYFSTTTLDRFVDVPHFLQDGGCLGIQSRLGFSQASQNRR